MIETWYAVLSFMLIGYVVLDGRNFGVGMLHYIVAKTPAERRQVIAAIGPLWSWDEVWLLSFGGTLFVAFPHLLASALSGYYLALFLILWCLILRGISIEIGGHIDDRMWQSFWDFVFVFANVLLGVLFGAAAGNLMRGVPLDPQGDFFVAFFTDFGVRGNVGLLDWYTLSVAVFSVVMLAAHGATFLTMKTEGPVHDRSMACRNWLWIATIPLFIIISLETWYVRPELPGNLVKSPFAWMGIVLILTAIAMIVTGISKGLELRAFGGSNFLIIGVLATGAATIFPVMLLSTLAPESSLTAYNASAHANSLWLAAIWWPFALIMTIVYAVLIIRYYSGKVGISRDGHNPY